MSRPRAATSVAMRIEDGELGDEKRSMERSRAFWGIWEWRASAEILRFCRNGVRRRTEVIELVKIKVRVFVL